MCASFFFLANLLLQLYFHLLCPFGNNAELSSPFADTAEPSRPLFRRLDAEENALLQRACLNPHFTLPGKVEMEHKIWNGVQVPRGKYPWAAAILEAPIDWPNRDDRTVLEQRCGATIISKRHLITARHCVDYFVEGQHPSGMKAMRVLVGGVCTRIDLAQGCPKADMMSVEVEMVAFRRRIVDGFKTVGWLPSAERYNNANDVALIQLARDLTTQVEAAGVNETGTSAVNNSVPTHAACLAHPGMKLPSKLSIYGWGRTEKARYSPHLMEVEMPLMAENNSLIKKYPRKCHNNPRFCCLHSPDVEVDGGQGDSGTGASARRGDLNVLYGTTILGDREDHVNVVLRVQPLLRDICYYTGICALPAWTEKDGLGALGNESATTDGLLLLVNRFNTFLPV